MRNTKYYKTIIPWIEQWYSSPEKISLLPPMPTFHFAALVESSHWLIGRSSLDLHEEGAAVSAFRTSLGCRIHIFPRGSAT